MTITILIAATTAAILAVLALWALARRARDPRLARIREARALRYRHFEEAREIGQEMALEGKATPRRVRRDDGMTLVLDGDEVTYGSAWIAGVPLDPTVPFVSTEEERGS